MTNNTLGGDLSPTTVQGLKYSLMVLVYLFVRDLIKYALPLAKMYISDKLKVD